MAVHFVFYGTLRASSCVWHQMTTQEKMLNACHKSFPWERIIFENKIELCSAVRAWVSRLPFAILRWRWLKNSCLFNDVFQPHISKSVKRKQYCNLWIERKKDRSGHGLFQSVFPTNTMDHSPLEVEGALKPINFPSVIELEGSLPWSQEPATSP